MNKLLREAFIKGYLGALEDVGIDSEQYEETAIEFANELYPDDEFKEGD